LICPAVLPFELQPPEELGDNSGDYAPLPGDGNHLHTLSAAHLDQHNFGMKSVSKLEWIVVRIEVVDTGYGIRPKDMVESKLFCANICIVPCQHSLTLLFSLPAAFNQTEQGRQQGKRHFIVLDHYH
jgi:osomolarity two-component system sensor histidine kinase SLN1